jgi:microcystin-dependent protein
MSTPFLAEVKIISWNYAPRGWAFCNGQLLPINQNQALFSLLGTTYGGDGRVNFALPNLQGRTPIHVGNSFVEGQASGEENHTLSIPELPAHNHIPAASSAVPNNGSASDHLWAANAGAYSASANSALDPSAIGNAGGSQAHINMQPYLVLNFVIALQGIFPSRN